MWRVECKEAVLSWVQSEGEMHTSQDIYDASYSDHAFNAPIDALPLQIGVWVAITVLFTFSLSFFIYAILPFLCFNEISFQRNLWRLLTL